MFEPDKRVGASYADAKDGSMSFLPRGEAVTRFSLAFDDPKARFLVLGIARTDVVLRKENKYHHS